MTVQLNRLEWYSVDDTTTQVAGLSPLSDAISITARKGLDIKNNILNITLKNANSKYIDEVGQLMFNSEDVIKFFVDQTSTASDIGSTWYDDDNRVGIYILKEYQQLTTLSTHRIKLTCADQAYVLFNKVFASTYGIESGVFWTSPGIFRSVTRINTTNDNGEHTGTDNDSGSKFDIDAKFVSESGSIADYRTDTATALDGGISDSDTTITVDSTTGFKEPGTIVVNSEHIYYTGITATEFTGCTRAIDDTVAIAHVTTTAVYQGFPIVDLSKVWKPVYEWLSDLGQPQMTNYADEDILDGTLFYQRAFLLWIDKDNGIHFIPSDDSVDIDFTVGSDELYEVSLEKSVFDSVNMVIYNVGEDMYGAGVTWYYFDESSDVTTLKMRYQPMTDLINTILFDEYADGAVTDATYPAEVVGDSNRRFPTGYTGPDLDNWTFKEDCNKWRVRVKGQSERTSLTSDSDYNNSVREAALWRGRNKATNITQSLGGLRYKGTVTVRGRHINPGDLVTVTDAKTGLATQKIRVLNVTQTLSNGQWSTTLDVEEDEELAT